MDSEAPRNTESQPIPEGLPSIGPATLTVLRRNGYATARDVLNTAMEQQEPPSIAGVGPARWAVVLDWAEGALSMAEREALLRASFERNAKSTAEWNLVWDGERSGQLNKVATHTSMSDEERVHLVSFCNALRASDGDRVQAKRAAIAREKADAAVRAAKRDAADTAAVRWLMLKLWLGIAVLLISVVGLFVAGVVAMVRAGG